MSGKRRSTRPTADDAGEAGPRPARATRAKKSPVLIEEEPLVVEEPNPELAPKPRARPRKASPQAKPYNPRAKKKDTSPTPQLGRGVLISGIGAAVLSAFALILVGFVIMPGPGDGRSVELDLNSKSASVDIVERLESAGMIRSGFLMRSYLLMGGGDEIDAGIHLLQNDMSPRTLMRRLRRLPGGATVKTSIPEGYNKFDIAKRLHEAGICSERAFLLSTTDAQSLTELRLEAPDVEGFLFPATYEFQRNAHPREVLKRMTLEAERRHARIFDSHAKAYADLRVSMQWGKREIITLASIVEKEAVVDEERPIIASVFFNRLRDPDFRPPLALQSDPTAKYGCLLNPSLSPSCASPDGKITPAMIHDPLNAYSTYTHGGLPPGPIANPGEKSILAVLQPTNSKYLFFVAKGGGRHTFSEKLSSHNEAIKERKERP